MATPKIQRADERHRKDINRLTRKAKIGSGLAKDDPVKNLWFVRKKDRIVACAGLDFHNNAAVLTSLVVEKENRHKGIGSSLIDHRLGIAKREGAKTAALVTMYYHFNFYKRRGFHTCPRADLPENIRNYPQFTSKRYKKCAVMWRTL